MLCDLAHNFPRKVAELLERDRGLKRNFREESVTDMLALFAWSTSRLKKLERDDGFSFL